MNLFLFSAPAGLPMNRDGLWPSIRIGIVLLGSRRAIYENRGRESFTSPSLRTVRADLPHTALQSVVHLVKD